MNELKDGRLLADLHIQDAKQAEEAGLNLDSLADQLAMIANELRRGEHSTPQKEDPTAPIKPVRLASGLSDHAHPVHAHPTSETRLGHHDPLTQRAIYAAAARQVYDKRRRRTALFGNAELFGEPAWDILLDLYIAHAEKKPVSVSSACIGSAAPPTTGLRWLGVLAENDLILREHDPEDQRRVLVRLTDRGIASMDQYFSGAGTSI
ncbi:winged helix DNA-binding protein [Erythrobacter sp. Alg231-14]|uniref:winged helix DNA-binding protein n=1 Tax=Erythrobacter sp. Alg231-14 TaxID=1922225 RepID=UPI00307B678B